MRRFSSYGPVSKRSHFYVPRTELVDKAYREIAGDPDDDTGHYITVWAPRQSGKSWLLRELYWRLQEDDTWYAAKVELEVLKGEASATVAARYIITELNRVAGLGLPIPDDMPSFERCFARDHIDRPLVLILDEFDSLPEGVIAEPVGAFRNIYLTRLGARGGSREKAHMLHGLALIGVRTVVGVENAAGSPFNVQRSLHIPRLTEAEVNEMYRWYERESKQPVEQAVIDRVYAVTRGQPGLVSWFGELLTESFNDDPTAPIDVQRWENVYAHAHEAIYHFGVYSWLERFLRRHDAKVIPEFPTGNGKIDLIIRYAGRTYGIELKSFVDFPTLRRGIAQAGRYATSIGLASITLAVFVERELPPERKPAYAEPIAAEGGAEVTVVFLITG